MKRVLLDTSIIIDFIRRRDKEKTTLANLLKENYLLAVSIITHTELYAGKSVWEKENAREELEVLFSGMQILNMDEEVSEAAGKIRAKHQINLLDAIIAATALVSGLPLATLNIKDFKKIKDLIILK